MIASDEFMRRLAVEVSDYLPVIEGESFDDYVARAREEPIEGKRQLIAACILKVSDGFRAERQQRKNAWIASARLGFNPGYRRPCCVCQKFRSIAEAHHVVPLASQFDRGFSRVDHEHVWLCPNHHTILHLIIVGDDEPDHQRMGKRAAGPILDLAEGELEIILDLTKRSTRQAPR